MQSPSLSRGKNEHLRWSGALATTLISSLALPTGGGGPAVEYQSHAARRKVVAACPASSCQLAANAMSHIEGVPEFSTNISGPLLLAGDGRVQSDCPIELSAELFEGAPLGCFYVNVDKSPIQEKKEKCHHKFDKNESNNWFFWSWAFIIETIFGGLFSRLLSPTSLTGTVLSLIELYRRAVLAFPILTKSIFTGILGGCGDLLAQTVTKCFSLQTAEEEDVSTDSSTKAGVRKFQFDRLRVASVTLEGFFISGPLMHYSYNFIELVIPIDDITGSPYKKSLAAALHVIIDAVFMDCVFIFTLMVCTSLIQGRASKIRRELQTEFFPAVQASWISSTVFSPMQFVAFRYSPLELRVLFMNIQDVLWNAIMSYMTHRSR